MAGDRAAFEELYRRYARPLGAYGARVLRDRSRGEDVAQAALMRAYDALQRGTEPLRVKPWLYKIALNTALELKAKNGDVLDGESEEVEDTSSDMRAARADILGGVQNLPERQRKVFVLREIKGLPVNEVARRLELTNEQVEQALFAARNRLAEVLVFGERVDCEMVRGLSPSQLTHYERRALKSHLRSCPSCRRKGFGLSSIGFWLRDAWAWLADGGASAAKLGAVAITATVVSAPVVTPAIIGRLDHGSKSGQHIALGAARLHVLSQLDRLVARIPPPIARALSLPTIAAPQDESAPADGAPFASEESVRPEEPQTATEPSPERVEASLPPEEPASPEPAPLDSVPPDPGPTPDQPPPDAPPADTVPPDPTPAPADTMPADPAPAPPPDPPPPTP